MIDIVNLESLEPLARERLEPSLFDFIAGGAGDEWSLAENRAAWSRLQLLPRVLCGVGNRSLGTTVLGTSIAMPVFVPPMGFHGLCHADAEEATARATADEGTLFCASTVANRSIETIGQASNGPKWFLRKFIIKFNHYKNSAFHSKIYTRKVKQIDNFKL